MTGSLATHVEALRTRGYTVVEGILDAAALAQARDALESVFEREARMARRRGWHNDVYRVAYLLPLKHPFFLSFCQREPLLSLMRAALGPRCVVGSLNGLGMVPGGREQQLHIDQDESVPGVLLGINALHTLDDFTRENGCTRLVPGSQARIWTGDPAAIERAEAEAVPIEAPAGSLIAYDGAVWHAGSRNRTDRSRRALHVYFTRAWMRPHWDYSRSFPGRIAAGLTPAQRQLFGFDSGPMVYDSLTHWQRRGGLPGPLVRARSLLRRLLLRD